MPRFLTLTRLACAALLAGAAPALASSYTPDLSRLDAVPLHAVPVALSTKAIDRLLSIKGRGPAPFAATVALPIDLSGGAWDAPAPGLARWRTRVFSAQADSIALEFDRLALPEGAELWVYDTGGERVRGPYRGQGSLWTALVPGETAIVEARVPAAARAALDLRVAQVAHAFGDKAAKAVGRSGGCNFDVVCPTGNDWQREARSTVRLQIPVPGGLGFCSGSLVNNSAQDNRPFILTADHCGIGDVGSPASGVVVYWQLENSACRGARDASEAVAQTGTVLRASDETTDFALLELTGAIPAGADPYFAGWDASGAGAACGVGIHHPAGDAKKISEFRTPVAATNFSFGAGEPTIPSWRVQRWDVGTTEGGSSGSGLWNQHHRIVGTLSGGEAACRSSTNADDNNLPDYYARLAQQWDAGLGAWLDPGNATACLTGKEPGAAGAACTPGVSSGLEMTCPVVAPEPEPQSGSGGGGGGSPAPALLAVLLCAARLRARFPRSCTDSQVSRQ